jgi:hypothetical protein
MLSDLFAVSGMVLMCWIWCVLCPVLFGAR